MKSVKFIKDFANKLKGDVAQYTESLASSLVNVDLVATYDLDEELPEDEIFLEGILDEPILLDGVLVDEVLVEGILVEELPLVVLTADEPKVKAVKPKVKK